MYGFIDASKAFDRLKHSLLFQKLIDRKVSGYIIRIMIIGMLVKLCMYYVAWISCREWCTTSWHSVSIPMQCIMMIIMCIALSACHTGCCVCNTIMNNFMYADDLVIFSSPSSVVLRALIAVC